MLSFLPPTLLAAVATFLIIVNTLAWGIPLYLGILVKVLVPNEHFRRRWTSWLLAYTAGWTRCNGLIMRLAPPIEFEVRGLEGLSRDRSYLLIANHQSWSDIVILQHLMTGKIPFLRFFAKRELLKLPIVGGALWGLDFPLMRRHSAQELARNPALRYDDLDATRRACERYRGQAVTVVIFAEGTRFTAEKHAAQRSPFQHLLRPRAGGFAFVIGSMGDQFDSVLDVTIVYPEGYGGFAGMLQGQLRHVIVDIRKRQLPAKLIGGDYLDDPGCRRQVQAWLNEAWEEKDRIIEQARALRPVDSCVSSES